MSDKLYPASLEKLLAWLLNEWPSGSLFGFTKNLFFEPKSTDPFKLERYGVLLDTPIGVAAGPHTQLSQNIVLAWLMGARTIELKTIQTLDELDVSKPCIDMADEGYNCEWSQELKLTQSFHEYLNAWILIHILQDKLFPDIDPKPGVLFNLSAGYNLKGIRSPNVQEFLDRMTDSAEFLNEKLDHIETIYPRIRDLHIPGKLSDNLTLSTMHGCPPDEIEEMASYFIRERKMHTDVKLNPTLLGADTVRDILHNDLKYNDIAIPDVAFEHDLQYADAVPMIKRLIALADNTGVEFGLKLTNTLEVENRKHALPKEEEQLYLSGRALHPISINLAAKLQNDFQGNLGISFCAGVDYQNIADVLACNLKPVTVCSDLLKPGGYGRLKQYLDTISTTFEKADVHSIHEWIFKKSGTNDSIASAGLTALEQYAANVRKNKNYLADPSPFTTIKTQRELTVFDCVSAPCIESCATDQNIPDYLYHAGRGEFNKSLEVILDTNPLPGITGHVCDHLCQLTCTRNALDEPLMIREVKRYVTDSGHFKVEPGPSIGKSTAIIGAGPMGLSCAYFLARYGVDVHVYDSHNQAGGMVSLAIPVSRMPEDSTQADLDRLKELGIHFHFKTDVDPKMFEDLRSGSDALVVAAGAQKIKELGIPGDNLNGVLNPLDFLANTRAGFPPKMGKRIAIIGGGNTAMDAARTAKLIAGADSEVVIVYRRTRRWMPAGYEEVQEALDEGVKLMELVQPIAISENSEGLLRLTVQHMEMETHTTQDRPRPIPIEGKISDLNFDQIIPAIGQDVIADFLPDKSMTFDLETGTSSLKNVFGGGDFIRGASTVINAVGDGKMIAFRILDSFGIDTHAGPEQQQKVESLEAAQQKYAQREAYGPDTDGHRLMNQKAVQDEASRCLYCDEVCNICVTVCPNLSNLAIPTDPVIFPIQDVVKQNGSFVLEAKGQFEIGQTSQILNLAEFCNECGNCTTFCPTNGAPYKTKPHFYLDRQNWKTEREGYFLENGTIHKWTDAGEMSVKKSEEGYIYSGPEGTVQFRTDPVSIEQAVFQEEYDRVSMKEVLELVFFLNSLNSYPLFQGQDV